MGASITCTPRYRHKFIILIKINLPKNDKERREKNKWEKSYLNVPGSLIVIFSDIRTGIKNGLISLFS